MLKKAIYYAVICALMLGIMVSCADKPKTESSSQSISSEMTSSETAKKEEPEENQDAWGNPDSEAALIRPSFLSTDVNGDLFYCDDEGSIYKQLTQSNGLSKLYSSSGYDFFSVQYLSENLICAGYKNKNNDCGYVIFDLKEKTVNSAITADQFKGKSIHSLLYYNEAVYFLSDPDRYGRYTLYKHDKENTQVIANGVNEFVIFRNRIFYNIGALLFSANADGSDVQTLTEIVTHDFIGFTLTKDSLFYMSTDSTYQLPMSSSEYIKYDEKIKVYTSTSSGDYTFFCGTNGGIYLYSHITDELKKISDYTAEEIAASGEYLYLKPANPSDYPDVEEQYIIKDNIYRFKISELVESQAEKETDSTSSSLASDELTSSESAEEEAEPLAPEKFGR